MRRTLAPTLVALGLAGAPSAAQEAPSPDLARQIEALRRQVETQSFALEQLQKKIDDVLWFDRVGDVAEIDKVYIPTVPVPKQEETYGIVNARHPFRMWTYVFVPRGADPAKKRPLLLLPHGGVHADFDTYYTHVVRELKVPALARESRAEVYRFLARHLKK